MSMMCLSRIESLSDRFAWRIIDGELGARLVTRDYKSCRIQEYVTQSHPSG